MFIVARRGCFIALRFAILTTLGVVWPAPPRVAGGPEPFTLQRSPRPEGPVIITAFSTGLIWSPVSIPPTMGGAVELLDASPTLERSPTNSRLFWIDSTSTVGNHNED